MYNTYSLYGIGKDLCIIRTGMDRKVQKLDQGYIG